MTVIRFVHMNDNSASFQHVGNITTLISMQSYKCVEKVDFSVCFFFKYEREQLFDPKWFYYDMSIKQYKHMAKTIVLGHGLALTLIFALS